MRKKRILLMSDDLRMTSGVATVSKEIVMGTLEHYDWVQIGGAVKHPEEGKIIDMSKATQELTKVKDAYLKIYPVSGYGNPDILRQLIDIEKPDVIMMFTDPRFWEWLFQMEREIRTRIPIAYLSLWDCLPDPMWDGVNYASCDLIMSISKQSYGIHNRILNNFGVNVIELNSKEVK